MALNANKQFVLKNGEFTGSVLAHQSGYSGGMPVRMNSTGEIARVYSDTGFIGIHAKGSDVNASGAPITYYFGPGIYTLEKGSGETAYPYDEDLTYDEGDGVGVIAGEWSNNAPATVRARVLAVGTVSGGKTLSLTLQFI